MSLIKAYEALDLGIQIRLSVLASIAFVMTDKTIGGMYIEHQRNIE